jgi:hypothetical protein
MRPALLLICSLLSLSVTPVSSQFVIRMKVVIAGQVNRNINQSFVTEVVWHMNHWFRKHNAHIQLMNVTEIPPQKYSPIPYDIMKKADNKFYDLYQVWSLINGLPHVTLRNRSCLNKNDDKKPFAIVTIDVSNKYLVMTRSIQSILTSLGLTDDQQSECKCHVFGELLEGVCILNKKKDVPNLEAPPCFTELLDKKLTGVNCTNPMYGLDRQSIPICGNGIIEDGEECDCFNSDRECNRCCLLQDKKHECRKSDDESCRSSTTIMTTLNTTESTTTTTATRTTTSGSSSPVNVTGIIVVVSVIAVLLVIAVILYFVTKSNNIRKNEVDQGITRTATITQNAISQQRTTKQSVQSAKPKSSVSRP